MLLLLCSLLVANKDELMVRFVAEMVFSSKEKILTTLLLEEKRQHHNLMEKSAHISSHALRFGCCRSYILSCKHNFYFLR